MALSDLKRLRYALVGVLHDLVNDKISSKGKAAVEEVITELKVIDEQTHAVSHQFEAVSQEEIEWHVKSLKTLDTQWAHKCAENMEKMWRNLKKVDKRLLERE